MSNIIGLTPLGLIGEIHPVAVENHEISWSLEHETMPTNWGCLVEVGERWPNNQSTAYSRYTHKVFLKHSFYITLITALHMQDLTSSAILCRLALWRFNIKQCCWCLCYATVGRHIDSCFTCNVSGYNSWTLWAN